jgi:capsular polysaccharide biosynthesis protein
MDEHADRWGTQQVVRIASIPLILAVIGLAFGLMYSLTQATLYESRSQVVVSPAGSFLDPAASSSFPAVTTSVQQLALSQLVTQDAARRMRAKGYKGTTADYVRKHLKLTISGETPILQVSGLTSTQVSAQVLSVAETNALTKAIAVASGPPPVTGPPNAGLSLEVFTRGENLGKVQPDPARNALLGALAGLLLGSFIGTLIVTRVRASASR